MEFVISRRGSALVKATLHDETWGFTSSRKLGYDRNAGTVTKQAENLGLASYSSADGQASIKPWNERLGHTCDHTSRLWLIKGIPMVGLYPHVKSRDVTHVILAKGVAYSARKRQIVKFFAPNQVVYADLMFPVKTMVFNSLQYS
ncbi:unnamed protein product [Peronospora belbahrii]|uniref:Uncharacterized protein n=1 Tax=Peronospora belbahrii TaxID=622444 RepID=A0AAU9KWG9_9STRA|nr:unnamed protein product [Peronospora belbahrii]